MARTKNQVEKKLITSCETYDELIFELVKNGAKFGGAFDTDETSELLHHSKKRLPSVGLSWRTKITNQIPDQIDIFAGDIDPKKFTCKCDICLNTPYLEAEDFALTVGVEDGKLTNFWLIYNHTAYTSFNNFDTTFEDLYLLFEQIHIKFCSTGFPIFTNSIEEDEDELEDELDELDEDELEDEDENIIDRLDSTIWLKNSVD